jgi:hypothetical protein
MQYLKLKVITAFVTIEVATATEVTVSIGCLCVIIPVQRYSSATSKALESML